ncbi:MAG: ABC transporter ATP-binding protein [Lachnospiraceae bacterium]|nr:ABC transporter ATP-binding protein [Lachnospiraceae bacterium]
MKHLLKYLKPYLKETILAPAFKLIEALVDLFVPLVIADIIDRGIATGNKHYIILRFFLLVGLAMVGLAFSITAQFFSARASVGFAASLREKLFSKIQNFSFEKLDKIGTETLVTRINADVLQVQTGVNMVLRLVLRSPFIVFGSMIMAFTINVKAAFVFAVSIPVLTGVIYLIMGITIPLYKKVQGKLDGVMLTTRENLTGVRVIRAFCKEDEEVKEFDAKSDALTRFNLIAGRIGAIMNPATYVLINIATCAMFLIAGNGVNEGLMGKGNVVALYNYMAQMIVELVKLASLIITINKALACADRVSAVLKEDDGIEYTETDEEEEIPATDCAVAFKNVSFSYQDASEDALSDMDFCVQKGQTVGVIGGTGCGKSTLMNLIPRFYDVTKGSVEVFGKDVKSYKKGELISHIGIVPQKAVLFAGSIRDNLKWGNEEAKDEELYSALEIAQAKDVVDSKEGGLDAIVEQGGRNFSGGQRQRLTIARALVKKPDILILDDSSSALDYATDFRLRKALAELKGQTTTFIVSQRTSSIQNADFIIVLDDGKIAGTGTHEELLQTCDVYQEIYASQASNKPGEVTA